MEHLYAPWREDYVKDRQDIKGCVFCHIVNHPEEDEKNRVLLREKDFFIIMNKYPYTPGHFMIIPNIHIENLEDLDDKVWLDMSLYAKRGVEILKKALGAKGVNIGMNLGRFAGAGIMGERYELHNHYRRGSYLLG